jgi:hypothetical protein
MPFFLAFGFEGYLPTLRGLSFGLFRFDLFSGGRTVEVAGGTHSVLCVQ